MPLDTLFHEVIMEICSTMGHNRIVLIRSWLACITDPVTSVAGFCAVSNDTSGDILGKSLAGRKTRPIILLRLYANAGKPH